MASAGQAQAHSSQPTHFSSPSGGRLSWCRPWERGCVGALTSGDSSVAARVNIVVSVPPKPAILSRIDAPCPSWCSSRGCSAPAPLLAVCLVRAPPRHRAPSLLGVPRHGGGAGGPDDGLAG